MKFNGKTGDRVPNTGVYVNKYGKKLSLSVGDVFPPCPKEGKALDWEKID